jgi:uncharacterized damage-inducible protein DinB
MPVPAVIAAAAENYRFNSDFLARTVQDLSPKEWLRRPDEKLSHITWIVGHVVYVRKVLLGRLGTEWSQPWLSSFARGVKCNDVAAFPSPDTLMGAWREISEVLAGALDGASEDMLAQPSTQGPPSLDGKISGLLNFLAIHETYHLGQASYLRSWMGHKGLMG